MNNYVFITRDFHILPLADRLRDDGKRVVVGMVQEEEDKSVSKDKTEARLSLYDGILDKRDADEVLKWMKDLPNKDEWFCMFDYGDLWEYSEASLDMGFTKGLFPTEKLYALEKDRKLGKAFAQKHYPKLKVAPVHEFKKVADAIAFLDKEKDKIYVLKSEGSNAETVVPSTQDFDLAKRQIIGALQTEAKGYEREGFTLEERIKNPVELTPVMVCWEGKPLYTCVEFENKPIGAGNIGRLSGGCQNLTIATRRDAKINQIAFPPIVFEMAKKQPGLSVFDAGLLYDGKDFVLGEFCGMRFGFPGFYAEIEMAGDMQHHHAAVQFFDKVTVGKYPLTWKHGAAVRMFQTEPDGEKVDTFQSGYCMDWLNEVSDQLYLYQIKREKMEGSDKPQFVSVGYDKDVGECTGAGASAMDAIDQAYRAAEGFAMTGTLYRPKFDFLSRDYPTSIMNRLRVIERAGLL